MKERNTRQKDIITDIMMKTKSHPTAREVCHMVKQVDSSIGQATVYRQLHRLLSDGKIRCVVTIDGEDHYDWNTSFHAHFVCNRCHQIYDVVVETKEQKRLFQFMPHLVLDSNITAHGLCEKCLKEDNNEISV